MHVKERYKLRLLRHLGDPEIDFPPRRDYPQIVGVSKKTIYKHFTPLELSEIEAEAVDMRKKSCSRQRANVLSALYERAIGYSHPDVHISTHLGDVTMTDIIKHFPPDRAAAQEFLDRTEGKVPDKVEMDTSSEVNITVTLEDDL